MFRVYWVIIRKSQHVLMFTVKVQHYNIKSILLLHIVFTLGNIIYFVLEFKDEPQQEAELPYSSWDNLHDF
jgi:hypothetical protein